MNRIRSYVTVVKHKERICRSPFLCLFMYRPIQIREERRLSMRGAVMTRETAIKFDGLNAENRDIVSTLIDFLTVRQSNEEFTRKVIEDADNGIDLSEPFDNVDDLMVALDA